jgi:thymidylate synthase
MVVYIKKPSVRASYEEIIPIILEKGNTVVTEDNQKCKEIQNMIIEITNPKLKGISDKYPIGKKAVEQYTNNLLYGNSGDGKFVYDYYERIREYPNYNRTMKSDQIDYVINKLNSSPLSRRCVISLWNPYIDQKVKDVPCLNHITFTKRDDNLYVTVLFRSNDALCAYHANAIGLIALCEMVAKETNTKLKNYVHHSVNMHIYIDRDRDYIEKYFPEYTKYLNE